MGEGRMNGVQMLRAFFEDDERYRLGAERDFADCPRWRWRRRGRLREWRTQYRMAATASLTAYLDALPFDERVYELNRISAEREASWGRAR